MTWPTAEAAGVALAKKLGLPEDATADQLRALPADKLVGARGRAGPIVDGRLVVESADAGLRPRPPGARAADHRLEQLGGLAAAAVGLCRLRRGHVRRGEGGLRRTSGRPDASWPRRMFTDAVMGAPARWFAAQASKKARRLAL